MSDLHAKVFTALQALTPPVDTDQILATAQSIITDGRKLSGFTDWLEIHGDDLAAKLNAGTPAPPPIPAPDAEDKATIAQLREALSAATLEAAPDAPWLQAAEAVLDRTGGRPEPILERPVELPVEVTP